MKVFYNFKKDVTNRVDYVYTVMYICVVSFQYSIQISNDNSNYGEANALIVLDKECLLYNETTQDLYLLVSMYLQLMENL